MDIEGAQSASCLIASTALVAIVNDHCHLRKEKKSFPNSSLSIRESASDCFLHPCFLLFKNSFLIKWRTIVVRSITVAADRLEREVYREAARVRRRRVRAYLKASHLSRRTIGRLLG